MKEVFEKHTTIICLTVVSSVCAIAGDTTAAIILWILYGIYKISILKKTTIMANWIYTIDIKDVWSKYKKYSHEDYDFDIELFNNMKNDFLERIEKQIAVGHKVEFSEVMKKLRSAKHLSSFNKYWNELYDICDYKRIWLKTNF